jgi:DnaJ-domain-containing protein 1
VIRVLYFSDRDVRAKLFESVGAAGRWLIVSAARHENGSTDVEQRQPYASIERQFGARVDQIVVADDGTPEGMWRDPLGDLADAFYPRERQKAYSVSTGYTLLRDGKVRAVVRKHANVNDDLWFIQQALSRVEPSIPAPRGTAQTPRPEGPSLEDEPTVPRAMPAPAIDPYEVLGLPQGTPLDEARKAFRNLVAQYHPDKVAHLAPEFRVLAEERTRRLNEAWQLLEKHVEGQA